MTKLNSTALQAKLLSVLSKNRSMKAVSKMLTKGFKLEKTADANAFNVVMKDEVQKALVVADRFVVISYAKPKGAKEQVLFLNKSVAITSLKSEKAIVIDLQEKTVENADIIAGFKIQNESLPVAALMSGVRMTTVRNYINHTQLYIAEVMGKVILADNIKEVRQVLNTEIASMNEIFSPVNMEAFAADMEAVAS
jgi:hypothetical protein